jgi:putative transposase
MKKPPGPHYRHRFPAELISHAVWLCHVFSLSFRDVELILAEPGMTVSHESVRRRCLKFGASEALLQAAPEMSAICPAGSHCRQAGQPWRSEACAHA